MHVQMVTYRLAGISEREYIDVADQVAPMFASMPGLLAKVWLEDPETGTYGALYFWDDREAMDRFFERDLFEGTNPEFDEVTSQDFAILENLTRATQPMLEVLEEPTRPLRPATAPTAGAALPPPQALTARDTTKRRPVRKTPGKKTPAKAPGRKTPAKAPAGRSPVEGRTPGKRSPVPKKAPGKRTSAAVKVPGKKSAAAVKAAGKKAAAKKAPAKKAPARKAR